MMKFISILLVITICLGCSSQKSINKTSSSTNEKKPVSQSKTIPKISETDLQIGNIKTDLTYKELTKVIGQEPVKVEKSSDNEEILNYGDGTEIVLVEGTVYSIKVSNQKYLTPRGLRVGDLYSKVRTLYGAPNLIENDQWIYKFANEDYDVFYVMVSNGVVREIKVSLVM